MSRSVAGTGIAAAPQAVSSPARDEAPVQPASDGGATPDHAAPTPAQTKEVITNSPALPGLDLSIFLLLLVELDSAGLLHIYSLGAIYGEALFYGLGLLATLFALALLFGPTPLTALRRLRPAWRVFWLVVPLAGAVALAWPAVAQLFAALPAFREHPDGAPPQMPADYQQALLIFALVALPLLAGAIGFARAEATRRRALTVSAAVLFAYAIGNLLYHITGGPAGDAWNAVLLGGWVWVLLALAVAALLAVVFPLPPLAFLGAALVLGLALRLIALGQVPVSMNLGDMLPLIQLATDRLLGGASPYHLYNVPYDLPLTYWPLNVLPFVPLRALGLDVRYANLLLGPVVGLLLLLLRRGRRDAGWACYAFGALYLTPTMLQWDLVTAAPPFWLWVAVLLAVVAADFGPSGPGLMPHGRELMPGAALGAAVAAGPLVLPFLPFIGLLWLKRGWRYAAAQVVVAAGVLALFVLPFALADWDAYWLGTVRWFNDLDLLPRIKWAADKSWILEIGLAGQFWKAGLEDWLKTLQIAVLLILAVLAWWRVRTPAAALRWGSAAYLLFMVLNPVIWPYLFTPALLGLVFTLAARREPEINRQDARNATTLKRD